MRLNESPSIGSRVVPCGRTDKTKLIVAFRNFANAPKNRLTRRHIRALNGCVLKTNIQF